jgi:hypothetical protein
MSRDSDMSLVWILAFTIGGIVVAYWVINGGGTGPAEWGGVLGTIAQAATDAVALVTRGKRLTNAPYDKTTGVVPGAPQSLADQTTYDLETYSLARAISSEEGNSSDAIKLAIGWAIKNHVDAGGGSITAVVTRANYSPHAGFYGTQRNIEEGTSGYNGSDRYCSTANDPYDGDAQIAYAIQTGSLPDPTGGAQYFDRPLGENAAQVAANRQAAGLSVVDVPGVDSSLLRFWA